MKDGFRQKRQYRVSRQLHDEANETLHKDGIFRMYLNSPISGPSVLALNSRIQNFNILMYLLSSKFTSHSRLFPSEHDKLTLEYIKSYRASRECHLTLIFPIISFLYLQPRVLAFIFAPLADSSSSL